MLVTRLVSDMCPRQDISLIALKSIVPLQKKQPKVPQKHESAAGIVVATAINSHAWRPYTEVNNACSDLITMQWRIRRLL